MVPPARMCVAIGMGSNLGESLAELRFGLQSIRRSVDDLVGSSVYETVPVPVSNQPLFLNACCVGRTALTPRQLLGELQHIEQLAGRVRRGSRYAARTLDLDLLLYGERTICEPGLVVPHPRLRERGFVLTPLAEIAAHWRVPGDDATPTCSVAELAEAIGSEGLVKTDLQLEDD